MLHIHTDECHLVYNALCAVLVECWTNWIDWTVRPKIAGLCLAELNTVHVTIHCCCFRRQWLSAAAWTHGPFNHHTPPSSFLFLVTFFTFVLHPHPPHLSLGLFRAGWEPESQKSGGPQRRFSICHYELLGFRKQSQQECVFMHVPVGIPVCFSVSARQNQPLKVQWKLWESSH